MTPLDLAVVFTVCAVGAFVQGSVGFGLNLLAAPVLALVDERFVPGPAIVAASVLTLLMAIRDRRGLHLGEVRLALAGRIPATVLAAVTVAWLPERGLAILFALLVLAAVVMIATGARVRPTPRSLVGAGALSGYMATATSIGGPPMAMLYANEDGRRMRGTLAGFFLIGTFLSIGALAAAGEFALDEIRLSLLCVPGILVGYLASAAGARRLDAGHTRPAVLAVSAVAAVLVLLDALT